MNNFFSKYLYRKDVDNLTTFLSISVMIILILRFLLIIILPLLDKTEARYAEIARLMSETQNWAVLQIDYGVPFWAKPPLSTWLSAFSFEIFGISEWAARLPSFLIAIGILLIVGKIVKKTGVSFYLPAFLLLTMPEFLLHTGVVSTDSALGFSVVLVMLSFWESLNSDTKTFWNYLFFIAIGLGLLAKGPIIIVLTGPPIFIWCLLKRKRFKDVFSKLPWVSGVVITSLIALPWYIIAEQKSPGFIDYFIIGEHFKRFFEPGWKGDLYGGAHSQPLGMIWLFLLLFAFPWIQIVIYKLIKTRKNIYKNDWLSFLVLWLFWTPFFFTFSKNILHTYIIPSLVPIALLMIYWWNDFKNKKLLIGIGAIFPALAMIGFVVLLSGKLDNYLNSDKYFLEGKNDLVKEKDIPVFYWKRKSYSSQFYSNGKVQVIIDTVHLNSIIENNARCYFLIKTKQLKELPEDYKSKMKLLKSNYKASLFLCTKKVIRPVSIPNP